MTLKRAAKITGLDIQVVKADKQYFVTARDQRQEDIAYVSGGNLKTILGILVEQVYAINRQSAMERASWACELCGSRYNLQCHHKIHRSMGRRDDRPEALQVLCSDCHERHHRGK
jgi:5-methylcytosine-specific restriction endonuclease McrA